MVSGRVKIALYPFAAATAARPIPVLPLVGSIIVAPGGEISFATLDLQISPNEDTTLPDSGTALTADTIYAVTNAVGTYVFTPPDTGWAHGKFTTGSSVSVSFTGTFLGTAPTIEASKTYEFDVLDGVWAVQEVVSA